jgi:predicted MFS family arabinose efflux permease
MVKLRLKKSYFIFACSFFFSLGGNILSFSLVYLLTDRFAFVPGQVGSFVALGSLFYFLGCNLYHRFGSAGNPAKIVPLSAGVVFLASLTLAHVENRVFVYGAYWALQLSTGLFWPPVMAWLTQGLDEGELNRELSRFNRSWMCGNLLGPPIAGTLYHWNSGVNFAALNVSYFTVLVLLFVMRRHFRGGEGREAAAEGMAEPAKVEASKGKAPPGRLLHSLDRRMDLYRYRGWIGAFCSNLFIGVLANIVPLHIRDGLGYTERTAGMVLFVRCLSGLAGFTLLARFTFWHFNRRWFIFVQAALMLCAFLFIPAGNRLFFYFVIIVLYGFINAGCYNNSIFYSSATGRFPKKNLALHEIFLSMGSALGSAGGGFFYQHFRFAGTSAALTLVLGMGLAAFIVLDRRERPAAPLQKV